MRWDRQNLFVIAGFVYTYLTVILPSFQMLFVINEILVIAPRFVIAGCHCNKLFTFDVAHRWRHPVAASRDDATFLGEILFLRLKLTFARKYLSPKNIASSPLAATGVLLKAGPQLKAHVAARRPRHTSWPTAQRLASQFTARGPV